MIRAPSDRRERILIFGESGSGKSSCWVSILNYMVKTKATNKMYLFDTDHAWDAMRDESFDPYIQVVDCDTQNFAEWDHQLAEILKKINKDDWLVVDMIDKAWVGAQDRYWSTMSGGNSLGEIYLKAQQNEDFSMGGDYGANWGVINKLYNDFFTLVMSARCHIMCIAPADIVYVDKKSGMALNPDHEEFVKFKFRPVGQKRLKHAFHSVILAREIPTAKGPEWNLSTIKERGPVGNVRRRLMKGEEVTEGAGFVGAYLIKVCGWKL